MKPERRSCEEGYVLVVLAGTLLILLGFAALAVDVGFMYSSRAQLQRAADAGALAGAYTFVKESLAPQPATANDRAMQAAINNYDMASQITPGEVTVSVDFPNRRVTVDIDHQERTFFGGVLGWTDATIRVRAVAEASEHASAGCAKPWFIMNTILASGSPCTPGVCPGQAMIDPTTLETNDAFITPRLGQPFIIKPGSPGSAIAPGQFYAIDLTSGTGANQYREDIGKCGSLTTMYCHASYMVEPGNMIGPTKQGVIDLTTLFGTVTPDTWIGFPNNIPQIQDGQTGIMKDSSTQIAISPIWDSCDPTFIANGCDFPTGRQTFLTVIGFAAIFIDGVEGNDVKAHLIGVSECGADPPSGETGPLAIPLRLVRTE